MSWTPGTPAHIAAGDFIIRSLRPTDITERYAGWWADPGVIEGVVHPATPAPVARHRQRLDQAFDNKSNFQLGIFDRSKNLLVGFFIVKCTQYHRLAEISLVVGDYDYRPPAVLDDAWRAALGFIFEYLRMEKIVGKPVAGNDAMTGAYEARGFRREATLRKHWMYHDGRRADIGVYGLTAGEWRAQLPD